MVIVTQLKGFANDSHRKLGCIDIIICDATYSLIGAIDTLEVFDASFTVKLLAALLASKAAAMRGSAAPLGYSIRT
jgi:hypothetical protein